MAEDRHQLAQQALVLDDADVAFDVEVPRNSLAQVCEIGGAADRIQFLAAVQFSSDRCVIDPVTLGKQVHDASVDPLVRVERELLRLQLGSGITDRDPLAIGVMEVILEAGLRIPEDIAVIGCGNLHYNDSLRVALSSINQQSEQIGQRAADLVIDLIESKQKPKAESHIMNPTLVRRASSNRN